MSSPFFGLRPVCRKEFTHIVRDPTTLFFALLIPLIQLFLFGFAVDTNVRQVPTVVFDQSNTQQSRALIQSFAASDVFRITLRRRLHAGYVRRHAFRQSPSRHSHPH